MAVFNLSVLNELRVNGRDVEEVINGEPDTDTEDNFDLNDGGEDTSPETDDEPDTDTEDNFDLQNDTEEPDTDTEDNFNLQDDEEGEPAYNEPDAQAEEDAPANTDEPDTDTEDNFDLNNGEEGGEDQGADGGEETAPAGGDDEPDTDTEDNFDLQDGNADGSDGEDGEQPANGDNSGEEGDGSNPEDELNQLEDEIFSTLSDEQKSIKLLELKTNIAKIHTQADNIIDKLNAVPKQAETAEIFNNIIKSLESLKEMSIFYVNNTFDTKTYTENNVIYKKYLVCLKVIQNILDELQKKCSKDTDDEK